VWNKGAQEQGKENTIKFRQSSGKLPSPAQWLCEVAHVLLCGTHGEEAWHFEHDVKGNCPRTSFPHGWERDLISQCFSYICAPWSFSPKGTVREKYVVVQGLLTLKRAGLVGSSLNYSLNLLRHSKFCVHKKLWFLVTWCFYHSVESLRYTEEGRGPGGCRNLNLGCDSPWFHYRK
jgi:hypothetical protein